MMDLTGRKALITGGAGHIGLSVAEAVVELGANVCILDLSEEDCEKSAEHLTSFRRNCATGFACDLSDELSTRRAMQEIINTLGGLDILIHCAAYVGTTDAPGWGVSFENQTVAAWDSAMRVNLTAPFVMAQEAYKFLTLSGHGSIILFGSIYGLNGPDMRLYSGTDMANPAGYGASKGGILQFTRYLATVFAPRVRVNSISPGGVWRSQPEAFHQKYVSRTPLQRMATEQDLKGAVAYLASDLSEYVTGHNLVVDGGWTAW